MEDDSECDFLQRDSPDLPIEAPALLEEERKMVSRFIIICPIEVRLIELPSNWAKDVLSRGEVIIVEGR